MATRNDTAVTHAANVTLASPPLASVIDRVFRRQVGEVTANLRDRNIPAKAPSLDHYTTYMVEAVTPLIQKHIAAGVRKSAQRIRHDIARRKGKKDIGSNFASVGLDVLNPYVVQAAQNLTLQFAASTNATSQGDLQKALGDLRQQLAEGLSLGETLSQLSERVQSIFSTTRARTIAATETSRAIHEGQVILAQQSGIVSKLEWIASADACSEICLPLDGKQVSVGESFVTFGSGPYDIVLYPPAHPNCMCSIESVLGDTSNVADESAWIASLPQMPL